MNILLGRIIFIVILGCNPLSGMIQDNIDCNMCMMEFIFFAILGMVFTSLIPT